MAVKTSLMSRKTEGRGQKMAVKTSLTSWKTEGIGNEKWQ